MDKIKALLEKAGCKPELTGKICESMESYKSTLREQLESEYATKVEQAKKVCIDETEAHKRELARRLQIFCETKGAAIESTLAKQSALNESDALTKLRDIQTLLSGVDPNGVQNGDVTATIKKAAKQIKVANEAKQKAEAVANRQTAIAERALKQNRQLATKLQTVQKAISEGRNPSKPAAGKGKGKRIDGGRKKSRKPVSSRATIRENQDRRPPAPRQQQPAQGKTQFGVDQIANDMDSDLV